MSAAIIIAKQNRIIRRYREANATSPDRAVQPEALGLRDPWTLRRLTARGVLVRLEDGRYYLQSEAAEQFKADRRIAVLVTVTALLIIWLMIASR